MIVLVSLRHQNGWTALMKAAQSGHVESARILLQAGADKDKKSTVWISAVQTLEELVFFSAASKIVA
jgi:hypothetical protein